MNTTIETAVMESVQNNPWQNLDLYASDAWEKIADRLAKEIYNDSGIQRGTFLDVSREIVPVIFPDGKMAIYISFNGEKEIPLLYLPEGARNTELPNFEVLPDIIKNTRMQVLCRIEAEVDSSDGTKRTIIVKYDGSYPALKLPDIVPPPKEFMRSQALVKHVLKFQRDELLKAAKGERTE